MEILFLIIGIAIGAGAAWFIARSKYQRPMPFTKDEFDAAQQEISRWKVESAQYQEAKNRLWLNSDVFVFPTYLEGMPYSLLEAMAAGCVPVTCPVGGIPDVMRDGEHGLFVPVQDAGAVAAAIRRLAEDRDELLRMSLAGRRRIAEQYTVDRLVTRFREIYERVGQ